MKRIETNNNGESAVIKKCLFINKQGYYWYSTFNGLMKIYGRDQFFIPYNHPDSLDIPITHDILESSRNVLWAATKQGVFYKDLTTGREQWLSINLIHGGTGETVEITSIFEDSKQNIWFGSNDRYIFKYTSGMLKTFTISDFSHGSENMTIVSEEPNGSLIIRRHNHWYSLRNDIIKVISEPNYNKYKNMATLSFKKNQFFGQEKGGTYSYDNQKYSYHYNAIIDKFIVEIPFQQRNLFKYSNEKGDIEIWLKDNSTLSKLYFTRNKEAIILRKEKKIEHNTYLWDFDFFKDDIITLNEYGFSIFRSKKDYFKTYLKDNFPISTRQFYKDKHGGVIVSTYSGFFRKEINEDTFKPLVLSPIGKVEKLRNVLIGYHFINDSIAIGYGYSRELYQINFNSKVYKLLSKPEDLNWSKYGNIQDIEPIDDNKLYIGGSNGLFEYDINKHKFTDRNTLSTQVNLKNHVIKDILLNKERKELWIGTENNGLYLKKFDVDSIYHFTKNNPDLPICSNKIELIIQDKNGFIWVGTDNGLQKIDPVTLTSENKSKNKGFKNQFIVGMLEDRENNNLWLGTYNGLVCYNTVSEKISDFFEFDGISNNEFNAKSSFKYNDSTFYFGSINGITKFNPKVVTIDDDKPILSLTKISHFDTESKKRKEQIFGINNRTQFELPYNQNYLTLHFAINDIPGSEKCSYLYKIKEINDEWVNLEDINQIQLQGLRAGMYTLLVKGYDSKSKETNNLTYTIEVQEVFYKTSWFRFFVLVLVITIIFVGAYYKNRQLKSKFKIQNRMKQLEARSFRALMNPHFIFNSLNGIQSTMITKGELAANKYIIAFSRLMRLILDTNNFEYVLLKNEISYIEAYLELESIRLDNNLEYHLIIGENVEVDLIKIPNMLIQPIVENAIIHGLLPKKDNRVLKVIFNNSQNDFIIQVEDNGVGRKVAEENKLKRKNIHQSWSSKISQERIDISNTINEHNISIQTIDLYENLSPAGTKVILRFSENRK
ncbi:sensor histidine kinase [uncultured Winogradskyella sp.]|uniref:sensor histidine kinase n=1 Tax=uncultured Winogradskyella sp. TaxID=395353 RepID=UPI00260D322D|nr:sensor histidine kinase [uncultured Winogradskyella sp.]